MFARLSFFGDKATEPTYLQHVEASIGMSERIFKGLEDWRMADIEYATKLHEIQTRLGESSPSKEFGDIIGKVVTAHLSFAEKLNIDVLLFNKDVANFIALQKRDLLKEEKSELKKLQGAKDLVQKLTAQRNKLKEAWEDEALEIVFVEDVNKNFSTRCQSKLDDIDQHVRELDSKIEAAFGDWTLLKEESQVRINSLSSKRKQLESCLRETLLKVTCHLAAFVSSLAALGLKDRNLELPTLEIHEDTPNCHPKPSFLEPMLRLILHQLKPSHPNHEILPQNALPTHNGISVFESFHESPHPSLARSARSPSHKPIHSKNLGQQSLVNDLSEMISYYHNKEVRTRIHKLMISDEPAPEETDQLSRLIQQIRRFLHNPADKQTLNLIKAQLRKGYRARMHFMMWLQSYRLENHFELQHAEAQSIIMLVEEFLAICQETKDSIMVKELVVLLTSYYIGPASSPAPPAPQVPPESSVLREVSKKQENGVVAESSLLAEKENTHQSQAEGTAKVIISEEQKGSRESRHMLNGVIEGRNSVFGQAKESSETVKKEKTYLVEIMRHLPIWHDITLWEAMLSFCVYSERSNTARMLRCSMSAQLVQPAQLASQASSADINVIFNQMHIILQNMILFNIPAADVKAFAVNHFKILPHSAQWPLKDLLKLVDEVVKDQKLSSSP